MNRTMGFSHPQINHPALLEFSYGFPMVFLWFSMAFLWFSCGFHWFSYGFPLVSIGFPMVFLWFFYGFSMVWGNPFKRLWSPHGDGETHAPWRAFAAAWDDRETIINQLYASKL